VAENKKKDNKKDDESDSKLSRVARTGAALKKMDGNERLISTAKALRNLLPGDKEYGDPLSVAGSETPHVLGKRLSTLTAKRPSAMREMGMGALQVWQSVSEAQGRGQGKEELAILFTDLVDFSDWALEAGDDAAIELLRCVGLAIEPPIEDRDGRIVKRLGDGLMAVFDDPAEAVEAALDATEAIRDVEVEGHTPTLRAGVHVGKPRPLGGDYFGVDVNVAARVADAAGADEVLISDAARKLLDDEKVEARRRWRFKAKGAPKDLDVYTASRAS